MKKLLLLLIVVFTALSCEGPAGPQGPPGESLNWKIIDVSINQNMWQLVGKPDDVNSYYMCEVPVPELSNFVFTDGNVFGYIVLKTNDGRNVQTPLPYSYPIGDDKNPDWIEFYSFDFLPGSVAFYVKYSDFATGVRPPGQNFRIVMNW